jgi:hypothetical protein
MTNKDKRIRDSDSTQLSEYCFGVCETLKDAVQGKVGDLEESEKAGMEDLERCVDSPQALVLHSIRTTIGPCAKLSAL